MKIQIREMMLPMNDKYLPSKRRASVAGAPNHHTTFAHRAQMRGSLWTTEQDGGTSTDLFNVANPQHDRRKSEYDIPGVPLVRADDFKVVLLGRAYGGKTSLFQKFMTDTFLGGSKGRYQTTIGAAYGSKELRVDGKLLKLGLWDTGGCERFESISRLYYRGAKAAIVCYDLTDRKSYDRARYWVQELSESAPDCSVYLCGTKKDLLKEPYDMPRQVSKSELEELTYDMDLNGVFETSSRTGEHIEEVFEKVALDYIEELEKKDETDGITSDKNANKVRTVSIMDRVDDISHIRCGCS